ncbi:MAG: hypothetical protein A2W09_02030 [Deltaproteobacteria bacterium RBG_16_50_11]|nr:MAG: hypothetical protein A2W09_02030 [Deltaproteobacteria bacterium RBG_16_50_11]
MMEKDRLKGYATGLEQILKSTHLSLKEAIAHFQEICQRVTPEKNIPFEIISDIRSQFKEIQDQLIKIKGIKQLLEGKYRIYYHRNPIRDREIMEFGFLAKNTYLKFEYTLKGLEAERGVKERVRPPEKYVQMVPWFRGQEKQAILLRNLLNLSALAYRTPSGPKSAERRQVIPNRQRSLSLFILAGEGTSLDDLESGIQLREYDITERYGRDEFRGALAHLRGISVAEVMRVMRRFTQRGDCSRLKCLLLPIESPGDLRKDALSSTERILQKMTGGDVKTLSI